MTRSDEALVVTGLGLSTALGPDVATNWRALVEGQCGFTPIECFDVAAAKVHDGGVAQLPEGLDVSAFLDGRSRALGHYRDTIAEAFASAGIDSGKAPHPERAALAVGSSLAASASSEEFWTAYLADGPAAPDYRDLRSYDVEPMLAELAERFAVGGEAALVSNACAAGASALVLAREMLLSGEADLVIAAGGDTLELHTFAGFHSLSLLSPEALRPFGEARQGMKLGDGFAALLVERESDALAAGRRPLARLLGAGESADAHSLTQPHPEGLGAALAMRRAMRVADCVPDVVDYVNLHATATPSNDVSEYRALASVFGERLPEIPLHAVKPAFGHTLGAAGAVEAVVSIKVLEHQLIPPTLGVESGLEFEGVQFLGEATERPVRCAMSNSFGFGGANASLLFGRCES